MNEVNIFTEHQALHAQALALAFEFHRVEAELNAIIDRLYDAGGGLRRELITEEDVAPTDSET